MPQVRTSSFTIGTLARQAGVAVDTIRYYERERLLPAPRRTAAGYRVYVEDDVRRIGFIRRAKALGFTLDEIRDLLRLEADHDHGVEGIKRRTQARLQAIDRQIAQLQTVRERLGQLVEACPGSGAPQCCPILSSIHGKTPPDGIEHTPIQRDPARIPAA